MSPRPQRRLRTLALVAVTGAVLCSCSTLQTTFGSTASDRATPTTGTMLAANGTSPSSSSSSTTTTTKPVSGNGPAGPWKRVFDDEFNGTSLDTKTWATCYFWDCTNRGNNELEWYQASQVTEQDGHLNLTAAPDKTHGKQYASGLIQSRASFDFTYGLVEFRAKDPGGLGTWSAFWLLPTDGDWPPEIDIMENWGQQPELINMYLHMGHPDKRFSSGTNVRTSDSAFHTYAVDWEPHEVRWYIDGILKETDYVSINMPMYLIANLAISGVTPPNKSTPFPQTLSLDWVRVYQHPG